jgi:hypothetical protein
VKLITLHPDADAEVTEAARYYESREPGLGSDLLGEVERAFEQILANPWYTQFIQNEYESWRSLTRSGDLTTGESG